MDPASPDTLRYRLHEFNAVVMNHRLQLHESGHTLDCPAYAPYYEQALVIEQFRILAENKIPVPLDLLTEYFRICSSFAEFEAQAGPAFRKILLDELLGLIQRYQAAICYTYLGNQEELLSAIPAERQVIGILISELKKDHALSEAERLIALLDAGLAGQDETHEDTAPAFMAGMPELPKSPSFPCDRGTP